MNRGKVVALRCISSMKGVIFIFNTLIKRIICFLYRSELQQIQSFLSFLLLLVHIKH